VIRRLLPLLLLATLSGCGYSATRLLPAEYQVIYIAPVNNKIPVTQEVNERTPFQTNLPGLAEDTTQGLITQFLFDGNLRVTTEPGKGDLQLFVELTDFYRQPLRRQDGDLIEEYRLNLGGNVWVIDRKGEKLWEETGLIGDTTYFTQGSLATAESAALDDLIKDFSRRVVERVIEDW